MQRWGPDVKLEVMEAAAAAEEMVMGWRKRRGVEEVEDIGDSSARRLIKSEVEEEPRESPRSSFLLLVGVVVRILRGARQRRG